MNVQRLSIPDVILITPHQYDDPRGCFFETYNQHRYREMGIDATFVQDNHSISHSKGIVRGLHCQLAPYAQGKLVRCTHGRIWDVAVDIRPGSATFGQWVTSELSAQNRAQLWIPPGFLHGFCTLTDGAEVQYKCTDFYNRDAERVIRWNSQELGITWPVSEQDALLSDKDQQAPDFAAVKDWSV
ncbi:MAG: dTDP-4-dehydrorhamnose 3,5-epimerase [Acetobacter syzygii]|jgi:dTDP-4-dehydrorhamnose 3,5-epimerase|uniref:dTDP-4-dehydrorhamnose 3,5-epimerase n=1 Tax=Acetobacter syzygii TaxID=146476 RepID=UPI00156E238A|nr:dTDP-4-dehydrorhamnose 3,5-epimerase [Acetobacter syzygii]NSL91319.1 dTDP-4-dehydrorhamnose 3,5-epimerase [Acetobacter syzygii]